MNRTISIKDVDRIANKLDKFGGLLEPDESRLLLAVFRLAQEEIDRRTASQRGARLGRTDVERSDSESAATGALRAAEPSLAHAFADAFAPLKDRDLRLREQIGRTESGARIVIEW